MMSGNEFPSEALRTKLESAGIPRDRHGACSLLGMIPAQLEQASFGEFNADVLAEVLVYLIDKRIIHPPTTIPAVLADLPAGTHICQLYRTKDELLELLVPYFKRGLRENEYGVWVVANLAVEEAREAMTRAFGGDDSEWDGRMEILDYKDWYKSASGGARGLEEVLEGWLEKEKEAAARGFKGLRVTGDPLWLKGERDWRNFMEYETAVHGAIHGKRIKAVCTYALGASSKKVADVMARHDDVVVKSRGWWQRISMEEPRAAEAVVTALSA
jgi:hypothetical protein